MKKIYIPILIVSVFCITFLTARSFRVQLVPYGSKYSCNTCHTNGGGTPRNPFGLDVESRVTPGGNETFWGPDLAALDSDGDGFTNGEELQDPNGEWVQGNPDPGDPNAVTHPGDPNDHPPIVSVDEELPVSNKFILFNNYPNPFNPSTKISFNIPVYSKVKLAIYNIKGELVNILSDREYAPGKYEALWNGRDNSGHKVSSGIYLYRLTAGNFVQTKRMILIT